jgi:hypothetical protein
MATPDPVYYSPHHHRWHRLLWILLGASLLAAAGIALVLYVRLHLAGGPSPAIALTTSSGETLHVQIAGRTDSVVKVITVEDGATHYLPLASLGDASRALVSALPVSLSLDYPLSAVLADQHARSLNVLILGRTASQVRFTRLDNHQSYTYAIAKLSASDQAFLHALPLSPAAVAASPATGNATLAAASSPAATTTNDLIAKMQSLVAELLVPPTDAEAASGTTTSAEEARLTSEISGLLTQISQLHAPTASPLAQADQLAQINQQVAQIFGDLQKSLSGNVTGNQTANGTIAQQLLAAQNQLQALANQQQTAPASSP